MASPLPCIHCTDLRDGVAIRTPGELSQAIEILRTRLERGRLTDISTTVGEPAFAALAAAGPWPDVIEHTLICTDCARRFRFSIDTYHGRGGSIALIDHAEPVHAR
jgi:hypothetical protein